MFHRLTSMNFRRTRSPWVVLMCALLLVGAAHAVAQVAPSPDAPPEGPAGDPNQDDQSKPLETLKVNVNLVSLYFTVHDKHGALIPHLTKDDFNILEDKAPQKIKNFTAENDQPLTLGILLDTSGSQQNVLPLEQEAGAAFLSRVLRSKDEAFLISFDVNLDLLSDYTSNAHALARAMDKAEINVGTGGGGGMPSGSPKGTLLYDAVYRATHEKLQQETGRKALIILTDGEDQGSVQKLQGAIEAAQKANTIVYVLLADRGSMGGACTPWVTAATGHEENGGRDRRPGDRCGQQRQEDGRRLSPRSRKNCAPSTSPAIRRPTPNWTGGTARSTSSQGRWP